MYVEYDRYRHSGREYSRGKSRRLSSRERMIQAALYAAVVMAACVLAARCIYEFRDGLGDLKDKFFAAVHSAADTAPDRPDSEAARGARHDLPSSEQDYSATSEIGNDNLILFFDTAPSPAADASQWERHSSATAVALPSLPKPEPFHTFRAEHSATNGKDDAKTKPVISSARKGRSAGKPRRGRELPQYSVRAIGQGPASLMPNDKSMTPTEVERELNSVRPKMNGDGKIVLNL